MRWVLLVQAVWVGWKWEGKEIYVYFSLKIVIATSKTSGACYRDELLSSRRYSQAPTIRHYNLNVYYMPYFAFCFGYMHIYL